jgi:hypothetical protein
MAFWHKKEKRLRLKKERQDRRYERKKRKFDFKNYKKTARIDRKDYRKNLRIDRTQSRKWGRTDRKLARKGARRDFKLDKMGIRADKRKHIVDSRQKTKQTAYENGMDPNKWISDSVGSVSNAVIAGFGGKPQLNGGLFPNPFDGYTGMGQDSPQDNTKLLLIGGGALALLLVLMKKNG